MVVSAPDLYVATPSCFAGGYSLVIAADVTISHGICGIWNSVQQNHPYGVAI